MKSLIAAVAAVSVLLTAGCMGSYDSGSGSDNTDFWGNPVSCSSNILPNGEGDFADWSEDWKDRQPGDLNIYGRPMDTPENYGWMVFYFEVLGLAYDNDFMNHRFCLPVDIHVFGKTGELDLVMLSPAGIPVSPEAHSSTTPWYGRFAIQYDRADPRFAGRPPEYEIHLDAAYDPVRDVPVSQNPSFPIGTKAIGLGCRIAVDFNVQFTFDNRELQPVAQDLAIFPGKTTTSCVYRDNHYNTF